MERWIKDTPQTAYRLSRAQIRFIRKRAARRKEEARLAAESATKTPPTEAPTPQPTVEADSTFVSDNAEVSKPPARASPAKLLTSLDAPEAYTDPGNRPLSARELEKARANKRNKRMAAEEAPMQKTDEIPAEKKRSKAPTKAMNQGNAPISHIQKPDVSPDSPATPRLRQPQKSILHEKPAPSLLEHREILRQPVKSARIVETAPKQAVKTADAAARTAARQASAGTRVTTKTSQQIKDVAAKNAAKAAKHMANLSRQAARKTADALRRAAQAAMRATVAAAKALVSAIISGGWVVVVIILVLLMCASILASPFGIFTHTDTTEFPDSITLSKAITTINEEYVAEIKRLRGNGDNVSVLIEGGTLRAAWNPSTG